MSLPCMCKESLCHVGSAVRMTHDQDPLGIAHQFGNRVEVLRVVWIAMVHVVCLAGSHVVVRTVRVGGRQQVRGRGVGVLRIAIG